MHPCTLQDRQIEEKQITEKRQCFSMLWLRRMHKLHQNVVEMDWSLEDGSGAELPVEMGRKASGNFLQPSSDRM